LHLWQLDEQNHAREAHVVIDPRNADRWPEIKLRVKNKLAQILESVIGCLNSNSPIKHVKRMIPTSLWELITAINEQLASYLIETVRDE